MTTLSTSSSPGDVIFGGKARALGELQRAGFNVPEFECSPADLNSAIGRLGFPLAVRSSASLEDGGQASFAGQFESSLGLTTHDQVTEAVRRCRASMDATSVRDYCRKHGIDPAMLEMGVVVQRMVCPELAGVAFSVDPLTGDERVTIEACEGLAADLLAGRTAPIANDHPLVIRHRAEIERTVREIQRHFGAPQDVEFAIERDVLYILQSRPITRIAFGPDAGEWTNADFRDGGVSSGVCTPLMWSLYDYIWEDALKGFLREIRLFRHDFQAGRLFFGRPYWNLGEVKRCLEALPGFVEREFDDDLSVAITYDGDGHRTPFSLMNIVRAVPTVLAIESIWKKQASYDAGFLASGFQRLSEPYETASSDSARFMELITDLYRTTETHYFRTIYCASLAKLDFKDSFRDADYAALVSGLPPLRHLEPLHAMRAMARAGDTDLAPLIERFRHHSRRELEIRAPRWDEDREWVRQLLALTSDHEPADLRARYTEARQKALAALPRRRRRGFEKKLDRLRHFVWLREEMRDLSSRVYYLIRRHVLAIAEARGLDDDIFFMTFREIAGDDRSNIAQAKEQYESYRNFDAPHEIGARFSHASAAPPSTATELGSLSGIAVSHGVASGPACVARTVEEAAALPAGGVLVCVFTDPGWTTVLDRAAAVVTETGGLLSHAAVICREYGIPAVLGVSGATRRILPGARVHVDGTRGQVHVDGSHPAPAAD